MKHHYSLHNIDQAHALGFSPDDYSRFKFGDNDVAKAFGHDLAKGFIQNYHAQLLMEPQIVVVSSPYSFIPTATFALKNYFVSTLNRWLVTQQLPVVQETKIHRDITYKEDYGSLSAEERMKLIGNDHFHIDKHFLTNKTIVFLDDIKITGSHERMILRMAKEYQLDNDLYMLYFAELTNKTIHPKFENFLNYHCIQSIGDLEDIITSGNFVFNTRVVKFILNYEPLACAAFLKKQSADFINQLYDLALGNGYHTIEAYEQNLQYIQNHLFSNRHKQFQYGN